MLALAGLPGTAGFIGKLFLIEAAVEADYTWLGVAIAVGTMISLAYYLRVVAAVWMRPGGTAERRPERPMPAMAGGSQEADAALARGARCRADRRARRASPPPRPFVFGVVPVAAGRVGVRGRRGDSARLVAA